MKKIAIAICLILIGGVVAASSQSTEPATRNWAQEPSSFLGIQIGKPIAKSVPECPYRTEYGYRRYDILDWSNLGHPCFEPIDDFYSVHNVDAFFDVFVHQVAGKVECVSGFFKEQQTSAVSQALIEKYGPALVTTVEQKQNRMGAAFPDHVMLWKGTTVQISFHSVAGRIDEGSVTAYTLTYEAQIARDTEKGANSIKGTL
jgi:hypothetical protein